MRSLKWAFIDGAMVVLPVGAIALLVIGIVKRLQDAADPFSGRYLHPLVAAIALLVLLCLLVGFLVRSVAGRRVRDGFEATVLRQIPGYRLLKAFTGDGPMAEGSARALRPALAAIEEGHCPALVMDEFADGRLVVFVPGSPAPMSGAIYVFTPDRVTYLDVPLMTFLKSISSWGLGLVELVEAAERRKKEASIP